MIKAVIFDMYETLITQYRSTPYFSSHIAEDSGIDTVCFRKYWDMTEDDRTRGKAELKQVVADIMKKFDCYDGEKADEIYRKRVASKTEQFNRLHEEIVPMLKELKERNIKIALISNCFPEEAEVIRKSNLFQYFDQVVLSCETGYMKPEKEIFDICLQKLDLKAEECLYVGDGGSDELYGARNMHMNTLQACWYLKEWTTDYRMKEFPCGERPWDVIEQIDRINASEKKSIKNIILKHAAILGIMAAYIVVTNIFHIGCPIRRVIKMPCPSCGTTRAWLEALKLDISSAFNYHPLFIFIPSYVWFIIHWQFLFSKRISKRMFKIVAVLGIVLIFAVYIYRMVFGFGPV